VDMITAIRRRVCFGRFRTRGRTRLIVLSLVLITMISVISALMRIGPMVVELALDAATDDITLVVNKVLSEKMQDGSVKYGDMVSLEKDAAGNITALVTNMANVNALQADITKAVTDAFLEYDITSVEIPVGSLLGGAILSGRGPRISVDILSIVNVVSCFRNEFSSAGINQTRHSIKMDVDVMMGVLLTGFQDRFDTVHTEVTVAETVIVGEVPNAYAAIQ